MERLKIVTTYNIGLCTTTDIEKQSLNKSFMRKIDRQSSHVFCMKVDERKKNQNGPVSDPKFQISDSAEA